MKSLGGGQHWAESEVLVDQFCNALLLMALDDWGYHTVDMPGFKGETWTDIMDLSSGQDKTDPVESSFYVWFVEGFFMKG